MADFAETITDERAGRRLARAIQGRGAFRPPDAIILDLGQSRRDRGAAGRMWRWGVARRKRAG
jgi:hypothetical protein